MFRYVVIGLVLMKYCFKIDVTQLEMWLPWIWQKITKLSLYTSQPRSCCIMSVCRLRISEKIRYKIEAVNISYNLIQIVEITLIQNYVYRKIMPLYFSRTHEHKQIHRCNLFNCRTVCHIPLTQMNTTRRCAILFRLCFKLSNRNIL